MRRAGQPGCGLAQPAFHFVTSRRNPSRWEMRGASKHSTPTTPRGSKTAHADFLIVPCSSPARPLPDTPPPAVDSIHSGSPLDPLRSRRG